VPLERFLGDGTLGDLMSELRDGAAAKAATA
jgi:hypothetical protein